MGRTIGLVSATLATASSAEPVVDDRIVASSTIDRQIEALRQEHAVPGLAVALIRHGEVVHVQGFGDRDASRHLPLDPDTRMRAASLTKATFAYLVMQLVDERRVDLDRSIADYLPKPLSAYPAYHDLAGDRRWRRLTFRILLDHTSGFANYRSFEDDGRLRFHWRPGSRYGYSGEGINLAQFVLEQGLGLNLRQEMQVRVFDRFAMTRSSLTGQGNPQDDAATGYSVTGAPITYDHPDAPHAASSLMTSPSDWSRFLAGVVRGDGLSAGAKAEMIRRQVTIGSLHQFPTIAPGRTTAYRRIHLGYGLGWGVFEAPSGHAFFKEGHDDGVANYALCIQPRQDCVLIMSTSLRAEGIFKSLADIYLGSTNLPADWEGFLP